MQYNIEVRLQIAALVLVEERNFSRAAERLELTQPGLSKRIAELELRLGFKVFLRRQKQVEVTESGQVFIKGTRDARALFDGAIRLAKTTHDEVRPILRIGHSPYADPALVNNLLTVQLPLYPNVRLRMESMFANDLVYALIASELDLALIAEPSESAYLMQVKLATQPLCVVLPVEHPAASKPIVELNDLAMSEWIVFSRNAHPKIYDRLLHEAQLAGVSPVELHHYITPSELLQLIAGNLGVAFAAKGVANQLRGSDIAVRPLSGSALQIATYLVLSADHSSRLANAFGLAFLRRVLPQDGLRSGSAQLLLEL